MKVSSILAAKGDRVATIPPGAAVTELVDALFINGIGAVVVSTDGTTLAGIVSERDIVRALAAGYDLKTTTVAAIMTEVVHTATPESPIDDLMVTMTSSRVRHLPILDEDGALAGIVSIGDVVKHRMDELEAERAALSEYINRGG